MKTKVIYREPLGNPTRKYRQDRFIISSCKAWGADAQEEADDVRRCIKLCKEIGCNMTEHIWADPVLTEECIQACEEFEIDGLFQNWNAFGGFQAAKGDMKIKMDEMKKFIEFSKRYRHFYGYTVWDEPLSDESVKAAAEQLNIIEELDPERLPYTVAIPSYNATHTWKNGLFEDYLINYAKVINPSVMALDYYPFSAMRPEPYDQLDNSPLFLDIALLRKMGLEQKTPMWFCIQAQDSPFGERYYRFTPSRITMQAYNVLLHGGKAIQLYNTVEGAMYNNGQKGPLYFALKEMNARIYHWGKTLMALTSEHVFHSPELMADWDVFDKYREPLSESKILANEELPYRCSVGELADEEGNTYLMILNRDYEEEHDFTLNFKKAFRIYEVSGKDGMQSMKSRSANNMTFHLEPGDALFFRFQDTEEDAYLIDYVLKK